VQRRGRTGNWTGRPGERNCATLRVSSVVTTALRPSEGGAYRVEADEMPGREKGHRARWQRVNSTSRVLEPVGFQHPTSNIQRPTSNNTKGRAVWPRALNVGCSMFRPSLSAPNLPAHRGLPMLRRPVRPANVAIGWSFPSFVVSLYAVVRVMDAFVRVICAVVVSLCSVVLSLDAVVRVICSVVRVMDAVVVSLDAVVVFRDAIVWRGGRA
jgi:hypothetical protein